MLLIFPEDDSSAAHPTPRQTPPRDSLSVSPNMRFNGHLFQRWIGDEVSAATTTLPCIGNPDEVSACHAHDHFAALDWEREEFERELELHFVVKDLQLRLNDGGSAKVVTPSVRTSPCLSSTDASTPSQCLPWVPSLSSTSTQPSTPSSRSTAIASASSPSSFSTPHPRPSRLSAVFRPPHKSSPSLLSLPSSHFSSCTSSSETRSISSPSFVSKVGRKLKPKTNDAAEIPRNPLSRRHTPAVSLFPKKRRLIVRGIGMEDERAVDGVKRWAKGLGTVSRISRSTDGAIWIEFQDKRVAENVCCLQAQVQIPHVGRVILDWAEGRHPG